MSTKKTPVPTQKVYDLPSAKMLLTLSMIFTNSLISTEELPSMEELPFNSLEKNFPLVERISFLLFMSLLFGVGWVAFYSIDYLQQPLLIAAAATAYGCILILRLIAIHINYKYSGYALRERDVLYRSGWLRKKTRIVMLNRVQHVSIQSGPLERRFNLSSVSIFTAGSSQADFTIKGITEHTAQRIKTWISAEPNENGDGQPE